MLMYVGDSLPFINKALLCIQTRILAQMTLVATLGIDLGCGYFSGSFVAAAE